MPSAPPRETTRERWARLGFGRWAEVEGLRLHYLDAGEGPAVFLLHGMGDCAIGWRHQVEAFAAAGFRAIAWDMMGAGLSEKPLRRDYSIPGMTGLFDAFRRRVGVERGALVGSSYGGGIALLQAALRPENVSALVVIDAAAYAEGVGAYTRLFKMRWFSEVVYRLVPARTLARIGLSQCLPDLGVLGPGIFEEYVVEARRPGAKAAFARFEQDVMPADPRRFEDGHRRIRVPTLVLWGRNDRVLPLRHGERLVREIPSARLAVLDAEHIPHVERPEEANRIVLDFLRSAARA